MSSKFESNALVQASDKLSLEKTLMLAPTRRVVRAVRRACLQLSLPELKEQGLIADFVPHFAHPGLSLFGPVVGSPASVLVCEPAIRSGVERIIVLGTAGALAGNCPGVEIGDVLFPRGVLSEEGTSPLYGAIEFLELPPSQTQVKLESLLKQELSSNYFEGVVWTTDAPYRETREKVTHYEERGAVAVEMELSALANLCAAYQVEFSSVLVVSDILDAEWISGFRHIARSDILERVASVILSSLSCDGDK